MIIYQPYLVKPPSPFVLSVKSCHSAEPSPPLSFSFDKLDDCNSLDVKWLSMFRGWVWRFERVLQRLK